MPKRLVCTEPNTIDWIDYELPVKLEARQVRVRNTHGAEKQGTMGAFVRGHGNKRGQWDAAKGMFVPGGVAWNYPIPLGNMQVGIVEAVGSGVARYAVGDRVVYFGGFAPSAVIEEGSGWKIGAETNWKSATCVDPATYAFCALQDGRVGIGDAVAIFSLGAIGLMAVQLAKEAGCHPIIAIDPLANRRAVALATGADAALDPVGTDVGAALREATGWRGVDVVIEYSGAMEAIQAAIRGVAFGGNVVLGGFPGPMKAGLDLGAEAHMNRPNLIFSRSESEPHREHPRWDHARIQAAVHRMIVEGAIDGELIVTPVVKFTEDFPMEYERVSAAPEKMVKLGVEYPC